MDEKRKTCPRRRDFLIRTEVKHQAEKESLQPPQEKGHLSHANPLLLIGCGQASVTGIRPAVENL